MAAAATADDADGPMCVRIANPAEFIEYNFGYDVVKDSCEALRRLEENGAKVVV